MTKVNTMNWKDAQDLVDRRLNKLAMCKRGSVATDINKEIDKLGPAPMLTKEEIEELLKLNAKKIQKAYTPTIKEIKDNSSYSLGCLINKRVDNTERSINTEHPALEKHKNAVQRLQRQEKERIAQLDADFQDVSDEFLLSGRDIAQFTKAYEGLEVKEW